MGSVVASAARFKNTVGVNSGGKKGKIINLRKYI